MRKFRLLAGLSAAASFALASGSAAAAPVTITFYNYNLASAGAGADATRKLIQEFMAGHPDIKVNAVSVNVTTITGRIQADIVAQRPVDLAQVVFSDLDFVARNFGAKPLETIAGANALAAHEAGMAPRTTKLGMLDGKTYGMAYTLSTPVLFYNADLFKAAGLDPDHPPQTWAQVKSAALAIKRHGHAGFAAGLFGNSASDWMMQGVVRSNGGAVISPDRKTLTFSSPDAVSAITMLRDMNDAGAFEKMDTLAAMESMAGGNLGMYLETSALQNYLLSAAKGKFDLRGTTMPSFGDKPVRPNNSGSALMILSQDPARQRAAWELMKFLTSKQAYAVITSEIGYLPLRPDIVDDPKYLGEWSKTHPMIRPNLKQLSVLEPWVPMPGPNYRQITKIMMDAMEQAVRGSANVGTTLAAAQDKAQRLIPR
ncbi:MAG: ABC transporter substrate-binding protein [Pandoraea sp.]|nr:ABC transporter substrate-binding protein [Pandoraea sp.]MDR3398014.1 ABC transporter substrate-binding protein [Pandoraea sp.]